MIVFIHCIHTLCFPFCANFPLRGNLVYILFISSNWLGIFRLNFNSHNSWDRGYDLINGTNRDVINGVALNGFSWKYFLVYNTLLEISVFTKAAKFEFDQFVKRAEWVLQTRNFFRKSHETKLIKSLTSFIYQRRSPMKCKFQLHIMSETLQWLSSNKKFR